MVEELNPAEEPEEPEEHAEEPQPFNVTLNQATAQRVREHYKQVQLAQAELNKVLMYALEAMGVEGQIQNLNLEKGEVTLLPLPGPVALPNRAARRRAKRG